MRELLFALLLAAFGVSAATAGDFTVAPEVSPGSFQFDVPDGHYKSFRTTIRCPVNSVRGAPVFTRWGTTTQWTPSVSLAFYGGNDFIGFYIFAPSDHSSLIGAMERAPNGHKDHPLESIPFSKGIAARGAFFIATWTRDGVVTVHLGSEEHTMRLGSPVAEVEIGGVSGAGAVNPLEFGHMTGIDATDTGCASRT